MTRNIIGSGLKHVAIGSILKRYQTILFTQLSKTLPEDVNFELISPTINIQKPQSKITRYGLHLPKDNVLNYFVS